MALFLTLLLIVVGLAADTWRAYVVQVQLSKAVDGAARGAAHMLNSGSPQQEAANIYNANFPNGWMGTSSSTRPGEAGFFTITTDPTTGLNVVDVRATAVVPTRFMRLANVPELRVTALGEATRRMVDFPDVTCAEPDNRTHANTTIDGPFNTTPGAYTAAAFPWNSTSTLPQGPSAFVRIRDGVTDGQRAVHSTKPSAEQRNCGWPTDASAAGSLEGRRKTFVHQQLRYEAGRRSRGTGVAILLRGPHSP